MNVRALPALGLLGIAAVLSPVLSGAGGAVAETSTNAASFRPVDARLLWLRDCATCHGVSGEGTPRGFEVDTLGAADFDYEIATGRMPLQDPPDRVRRHKVVYSRAEVDALVAYSSSLGQATGTPMPTVRRSYDLPGGGELFRQQCAACHAWAGDGGGLLQREAPDLHASTPTQIAEAIRVGPGTMPVFSQAALTDDQVNAVVAYVRYLRHPQDRGGDPLWHLGPLAEGGIAWVVGMGTLLLVLRWIGESERK